MTESAGDGFVDFILGRKSEPAPRKGDWMQTATGKQFWPLDPRPDEVDIVDVAQGLSKICRYGGHCTRFYSVAEHSVYVSQALPPSLRMYGLLHDASEAYLGDVIRPLKRFIPGYRDLEDAVMVAVCEHFGIHYPMPPQVKEIDNNILLDEMRQIMAPPPVPWASQASQDLGIEELGVEIQCWRPERAAEKFLEQFVALGGELS